MKETPLTQRKDCYGHPHRTETEVHSPTAFRLLAERLKQVSDPIRIRVLLWLGDSERCVGGLHGEIACSMSVLSRHLTLLRLAGLIVPRRDGQRNVYSLTDAGQTLQRIVAGVVASAGLPGVGRTG